MYTIAKQFRFAAAHHLPRLPEDHKCHRPHGHNYVVEAAVQSSSLHGETLFVVDYAVLADWWKGIEPRYDHRDLNHSFSTDFPTAEFLASNLFHDLRNYLALRHADLGTDVVVSYVEVRETDGTYARYSL